MSSRLLKLAALSNLLTFFLIGAAFAQSFTLSTTACPTGCGGGFVVDSTTPLASKTVCAVLGNERWQEYHNGSDVMELGNNPAGEKVGTWLASGGTVTYNYGTGGQYTYTLCEQGALYHFCGASHGGKDIPGASIKSGSGC